MNAYDCRIYPVQAHPPATKHGSIGGNPAAEQEPRGAAVSRTERFDSTSRIGPENSPGAYLSLAQRQMVKGQYESAVKLLRIAYNLVFRNLECSGVSLLQLLDHMMICATKLPEGNQEIEPTLEILRRHMSIAPSRMRVVRNFWQKENFGPPSSGSLPDLKADLHFESRVKTVNIVEKKQEYLRLTRLYLSVAQSLEERGRIDDALFCALEGCKMARQASRY